MQPLLASLLAAAESAPTDVTLRLHLVDLLREHGETTEAIRHCGAALSVDPLAEAPRVMMRELLGVPTPPPATPSTAPASASPAQATPPASPTQSSGAAQAAAAYGAPLPLPDAGGTDDALPDPRDPTRSEQPEGPEEREDLWAERVNVTLADIGGMDIAKERLEAAVLAPMRNPELRRLYRQSRTGGVLLYGPPGCGKTFLARATAGELDARFLSVTFDGLSHEEQVDEIAAVFQAARDQAPVVLCLVGIEFLGGARSGERRGAAGRSVNALAAELDKGPEGNLGITVMGTTNAPWEVDPILRRPGRLEQSLLVLPPDRTTREVVLHQQLGEHPEVDIAQVARRSRGYSGRDLAAAVRLAEMRTDTVTTQDVLAALAEQPPSAQEWLDTASRETAVVADHTSYVGLREYLAARRGDPGGPGAPAGPDHGAWMSSPR
ncbi:AAA family ATPase [Mobilicoccus pelagius]|uniref:Putative ATPase n=1 Tax=Mobilicoccus pelagius NBRC 104925 TaxID=1089455 RepID=H5UT39_9MICO|nr:ATP-binding protein [Mobilicoccus pelagius]GAB48897.1 putative ATPase [Mobilicoccus pelagius NBRC 104925]